MRQMILYGTLGGNTLKVFDLRQGLDPIANMDAIPAFIAAASNVTWCHLAVSPDKKRLVGVPQSNTSGSNFWFWKDTESRSAYGTPPLAFNGTIYAGDCSNTHYALGGDSPYLYVYDWATSTFQNLSTSGLGTVAMLKFSPDGSKLAVGHRTSPYLRVYSTTDWSYVNVATSIIPGATVGGVGWTSDSAYVVVTGQESPYACAYTADLSSRVYNSTSYAAAAYARDCGSVEPHPTDSRSVITNVGSYAGTEVPHLVITNAVTGAVTIVAPKTLGAYFCHGYGYDSVDKYIYAAGYASAQKTFVSRYKLDSSGVPVPFADGGVQLFAGGVIGSDVYANLIIIEKDMYQITGTVRDIDNVPAARTVRAYRRSNGQLMAQTTSDATSGDYTLILPDAGPWDLQFMAKDGENLNDLFYASSEPVLVSS